MSIINGNVGIGTTNPQGKLSILQTAGSGDMEFGNTGGGGYLQVYDRSTSAFKTFGIYTNNGITPTLQMASTGNVGIGTAAPGEKLDIRGNIFLGASADRYIKYYTSTNWNYYLKGEGNDFRIYDPEGANFLKASYGSGGATKYTSILGNLTVVANGNIGIGTVSPNAKLHVQSGITEFSNGNIDNAEGTQVYFSATGYPTSYLHKISTAHSSNTDMGWIKFSLASGAGTYNDVMTLKENGNVGIGTTAPAAKLHVNGQIIGGFGAVTTGGTANWNDATNARSGSGYTLLMGNAANGPGPAVYFHPFSFEYSSKDGTGNLNQWAISYSGAYGPYFRTRYSGTWTAWNTMWQNNNDGSGSGLDADTVDGKHASTAAYVAAYRSSVDCNGNSRGCASGWVVIQYVCEYFQRCSDWAQLWSCNVPICALPR
jgi:hypothetical protein